MKCLCNECQLNGDYKCPKGDIEEKVLELQRLINKANNYLSGGGYGALLVQEAARLFEENRKAKVE